jgi:hypothetical protein
MSVAFFFALSSVFPFVFNQFKAIAKRIVKEKTLTTRNLTGVGGTNPPSPLATSW